MVFSDSIKDMLEVNTKNELKSLFHFFSHISSLAKLIKNIIFCFFKDILEWWMLFQLPKIPREMENKFNLWLSNLKCDAISNASRECITKWVETVPCAIRHHFFQFLAKKESKKCERIKNIQNHNLLHPFFWKIYIIFWTGKEIERGDIATTSVYATVNRFDAYSWKLIYAHIFPLSLWCCRPHSKNFIINSTPFA